MNKKIILLGVLFSVGLLVLIGSVAYSKNTSWQNSIIDGVVNKVSNGILSLFLDKEDLAEVGVYRERGVRDVVSLGAVGEDMIPGTNNTYHLGSAALSWSNIFASGTLRIGDSSNNYVVIGNDTLAVGSTATKGLGDFAVSADGTVSTSGTIQVKSTTATSTINGDLEVDTTFFLGTAGANQLKMTNSAGAFSFAGNSANSSILGLNLFYSGVTTGFNAGKFSVDTNGGISTSGTLNVFTGGSAGKVICWKTASLLGYCSSAVDAGGACTCN